MSKIILMPISVIGARIPTAVIGVMEEGRQAPLLLLFVILVLLNILYEFKYWNNSDWL